MPEQGWPSAHAEVREHYVYLVHAAGGTERWAEDTFDTMLQAVKAEAWDEGLNAGGRWLLHGEPSPDVAPTNPYRSDRG